MTSFKRGAAVLDVVAVLAVDGVAGGGTEGMVRFNEVSSMSL
jgi:hypothetical protein